MNKPKSLFALRLLRWFCPEHLYEEIEGDLIQRFNKDLNPSDRLERSDGYWQRRAKQKLFFNVIAFFRPGIILRNRLTIQFLSLSVFQNYLKIGLRSLIKRRGHSFIMVSGLALGLAVCLMIRQYVEFEKSYDNFHENSESIYRAVFTGYENGEQVYFSSRFGYGLGPSLKEDMPEVATYVRIREQEAIVGALNSSGESIQFGEQIQFVDSAFFDVFTYESVQGSLPQSLNKASSIVVTQSAAKKYFGGDSNVLGKILQLSTEYGVNGYYEVTAVIKDVPGNAHLQFDYLVPIYSLLQTSSYQEPGAQWDWVNFITYVKVHPGADLQAMNAKTDALLTKYTGPNEPGSFVFTFEPLRQIHLTEQETNVLGSTDFLMLIAIFILAIAWVNFINLSTARAIERAKEVGVKKVMGVQRMQLISQFMIESMLINFISIAFGLIIAINLLPLLGEIVGKDLSFDYGHSKLWISLLGIWIIGSIVSGGYPAFVLSSFKTVNALRGRIRNVGNGVSFRKALIVFQFAASLLLIVGTLTIYRQIGFMQSQQKGMNTDQMLIVDGPKIILDNNMAQRLNSFKNQVDNNSFVKNISFSGSTPANGYSLVTGMTKSGGEEKPGKRETIYVVQTDYDFIRTYAIELIAGRTWDPKSIPDRQSVLISEKALSVFELGDATNALNERVIIDGRDTLNILGVFKNVHWNSLHTANIPLLLQPQEISSGQFSIQLKGDINRALIEIETVYKESFPGNPFSFYFLNDFFDQQYKADRQFGKIIFFFAVLAIFIACLGLWGLTSYTTLQRMKEIGIRKITGASVRDIISLLSWDYIVLLVLAVSITLPLVIYGVNEWLNNYAFRMVITPDIFLLPVVILFIVTLITVSLQIVKAALMNPVESLKNE